MAIRSPRPGTLRAVALGPCRMPSLPRDSSFWKTYGAFETIEKIGQGGMGVVYEARDVRLHRLVALKVLPASLLGDPVARARHQREAVAAAALNHPNVATIYEVGESEDGPRPGLR